MTFKIPKEFQLGGQTFKVTVEAAEVEPGKGGLCNYDQGWVKVSSWTRYGKIPRDAQERIFFHELLHLLFDASGDHALSNDESLVDRCSTLLSQALRSMR